MRTKAIIVDLDGTLANTEHRQHHLEGGKKNWKAFNEGCSLDTPNNWCVSLVQAMVSYNNASPIFITGRSMEYHDATMDWIKKHCFPYGGRFWLFMREKGNYEKDTDLKKRLYEEHVETQNLDILFVLEDRKAVVEMWRSLGLVCLQCAEGDF